MLTIRLSKYEQETIINFNEEDDYADVYTFNHKMIQKLEKMAAEFPEDCSLKEKTNYGAYRFVVNKRLVLIHKPRSKAWRENMSNRAKANGWNPLLSEEK